MQVQTKAKKTNYITEFIPSNTKWSKLFNQLALTIFIYRAKI